MKKVLIMIGIIAILIIGIFLVVFNTTKKSPKELALEYLNNTYSEEEDTFTFVNHQYDLFSGWNDSYIFKSEKYNSNITVKISELDNEYQFKDDYYKMYMYKDAKLYFDNIASNLNNCEVKIRFEVDYLNRYLTFEEYNKNSDFDVFYITNYDVGEQQKQDILNKIANNNDGSVYFYVTNDKELLKNIDLDNILNNQKQYIKSKSKYYINSEKNIEKIN